MKGILNKSILILCVNFCLGQNVFSQEVVKRQNVEHFIDSMYQFKDTLRVLSVSNYDIEILPSKLYEFKNLEELYLRNLNIKKIDSDINKLSKLKVLSLANNDLSSFPTEILNNSDLRKVDLTFNNIIELPNGINKLVKLEKLRIGGQKNELVKVSEDFYKLSNLTFLSCCILDELLLKKITHNANFIDTECVLNLNSCKKQLRDW